MYGKKEGSVLFGHYCESDIAPSSEIHWVLFKLEARCCPLEQSSCGMMGHLIDPSWWTH